MALSTTPPAIKAPAARNLVLAKQHLVARLDPGDWQSVPRDLVGVHAARFRSPIHSLVARVDFRSKADVARCLYGSGDMIKIRCMRGTLHIAPLDLARTLHSATWRQRRGVCERMIRACGPNPSDVEAARGEIAGLLAGSRMTSLEIESAASRRGASRIPLIRAVLKLMWESGEVCYVNSSRSWAREERRYARTAEHFTPDALPLLDEAQAETELIRRYLATYGPATIADATWWSGLAPGRVARAIGRIEGLMYVEVAGEEGLHLMFESEFEGLASKWEVLDHSIRLLAWEDNLLKGYMPSRRRFVALEDYPKVFNAIGEARATVTSAGRVVGIWSWNARKSRPDVELFRKLDQDERSLLTDEIERLSCLAIVGT